jgi:hypothetical protein
MTSASTAKPSRIKVREHRERLRAQGLRHEKPGHFAITSRTS